MKVWILSHDDWDQDQSEVIGVYADEAKAKAAWEHFNHPSYPVGLEEHEVIEQGKRMNSHDLATELDRLGPAPVFVMLPNGSLCEVDGAGDDYVNGESAIVLSVIPAVV